jgi:hypothetical protein
MCECEPAYPKKTQPEKLIILINFLVSKQKTCLKVESIVYEVVGGGII